MDAHRAGHCQYVWGGRVRIIWALAIVAITGATTAHASPPMPSDSIASIAAALPKCTGGWIELGPRDKVKPADLMPRLELLSRPSRELDESAGKDLYWIAQSLLAPATGTPKWMVDGPPNLKCPALPHEAVALMEYLMGEEPDSFKGFINAFAWLGLAYATGAAGVQDEEKARLYFLRYQMHAGHSSNGRWSDGVDDSLLGNVARAGFRPYFDALAQTKRGGAARFALAEAALPTDPMEARRLLLFVSDRTLNRLLELEEQNRVPTVSDRPEISIWAEAARTLFGYRRFAARMLKSVEQYNGGTIPNSTQRVSITTLRPYLNKESVAKADATRDPIPVRALVTPEGRAIWIEACQAASPQSMPVRNFVVQLDAARLYTPTEITQLPRLPVAKLQGRPVYSWVILPAVHFTRSKEGRQEINFVDLPPDRCVYSAIANAPPAPIMTGPK